MDFASELAAERELIRRATDQLDAEQSAAGLNLAVATGDLERAALERREAKRRRRHPGVPWLHGRVELADGSTYYVGDFNHSLDDGVEVAGRASRLWDLFHEASTDAPQGVIRKRVYTYKEGTEELKRFDDFDLNEDRLSPDQQERAKASLGPTGLSLFNHHHGDRNWSDFTSAVLADRLRVLDAPVNTTTVVVAGPGTAGSHLFAHRVQNLRNQYPALPVTVVVSEADRAQACSVLDRLNGPTRPVEKLASLDSLLSGRVLTDRAHIVVFDAAGHVEAVCAALRQGDAMGSTIFCSDPADAEGLGDGTASGDRGPAVVWIRYAHTTRRDIWQESLRLAGVDPVSWKYPAAVVPGGHVLTHQWDQETEDIRRFLDRTFSEPVHDSGFRAACPAALRGQVRDSKSFWFDYIDLSFLQDFSENSPPTAPAQEEVATVDRDDPVVSALTEQPLGSSHDLIVIDPDSLMKDGDVAVRLLESMTQVQRAVHYVRVITVE